VRPALVITATLILDGVFFVLNLSVAISGGSRAVLSQAVYTITDLIGAVMILLGHRASAQPASPQHPFGRGKERFFWAFTAGLVTFSLAGALVLVEGGLQIVSPRPVADLVPGLLTVAGTLASSLGSLLVVIFELRRDQQTVESLLASDFQGMKTIFLQDVVSVVGAGVALAGLALVRVSGQAFYDGLSASVVGVLLLITGFTLAAESRALLVGRAMSEREGREILSLVSDYPFVRRVVGMQSMMMGPEEALVSLQVNFLDELSTDDIEIHIDQIQRFVKGAHPQVRHLIIQPVPWPGDPAGGAPSGPPSSLLRPRERPATAGDGPSSRG
jgi:cation diffusion facilitator family transporter